MNFEIGLVPNRGHAPISNAGMALMHHLCERAFKWLSCSKASGVASVYMQL